MKQRKKERISLPPTWIFEEKNKFYQKLIEYIPGLPEETKEFFLVVPALQYQLYC